ncbi:MAG: hypothetical protein R2865_15670 [Deinococcales bacterium]
MPPKSWALDAALANNQNELNSLRSERDTLTQSVANLQNSLEASQSSQSSAVENLNLS